MTEAGKYLLLDRVAVGGMAEIYRAKSLGVEGFERIVVLKRILPILAEDREFVSMFVEEAKIAVQLTHANIVPIYELGKIEGTHFIAMEYVWGRDLRDILTRFRKLGQPMPPPMAAWIIAKVLEGLDYAHRKRGPDGRPLGIIHRDISPQNVLVSYDGLVKLCDFGIAKAAGRATQTQAGVIKGKLAYMSPEQIMGRTIDHRSDIFAASSLLHELLTGQRTFGGASDIDIIDRVREARAPKLSEVAPHVPPELEAIVMTGLAREPGDRYPTAGDMHDAIMQFIASRKPPYGTSALSRWMRAEYEPEMAKEREHLERLSGVTAAGVAVSAPSASKPATAAAAAAEEDEFEELSQIVAVDDIDFEGSMSAGQEHAQAPQYAQEPQYAQPQYAQPQYAPQQYAQEPQYAQTPQHAPQEPQYAPQEPQYAPQQSYTPLQGHAQGYAAPPAGTAPMGAFSPQEAHAYASPAHQSHAAPEPPAMAPPPAYEQPAGSPPVLAPTRPSSQPPPAVMPPKLGLTSVYPAVAPTPAAAPKKKSRLGLAIGAIALLLVLAGGGAAAWLFLLGGRAIVGF